MNDNAFYQLISPVTHIVRQLICTEHLNLIRI